MPSGTVVSINLPRLLTAFVEESLESWGGSRLLVAGATVNLVLEEQIRARYLALQIVA